MIPLLPLFVIKTTTIIVLTLTYNSAISATNEDPQVGPRNLQVPERFITEKSIEIYKRFKIIKFVAQVVEPHHIVISWNIEIDTRAVAKDNPERKLEIFENNQLIENVSINMKNYCLENVLNNGSLIVNCELLRQRADCINYKFVLGSPKNVAHITSAVPVVKNTTTFEVTDNEENPIKLTWKVECNKNNYNFPVQVPVTFMNNGKKVDLALEAVCNFTQQSCETYFKRTVAIPCPPPIIEINHETVSLNVSTNSVDNLSIAVRHLYRFEIDIEWTEIICPASPISVPSYTFVITENEKMVNTFSVPNRCITRIANRQKLTFDKNRIISSCARENSFIFETTLKPCVNYSVNIFHSENENSPLRKERFKKYFVIQIAPEDIQNLHVASLSSNRIELQWEISAACQKVENFTIPIEKNYVIFQSISLSSSNTTCNNMTCIVNWKSDENLESCKNYLMKVGGSSISVTTLPPGVFSVNANPSKSNNSSSFDLEWNAPLQCRPMLITSIREERNTNPFFISSALAKRTENCTNKSCHMRWRYEKNLEPCTTYKVNLGSFPQEFTTYPDFFGGIARNVTIQSEIPENLGEPSIPVILWNHPQCQKTKILKWQILIRKSQLNTPMEKMISNLEYSYKFVDVEACETYSFAIRTLFEKEGDFYTTLEKHFQADCPVRLILPISLIIGLLFIATVIALLFSRKHRKNEAPEKESENNVSKCSSVESRVKISSMSRSRLPSFNRNRTSCGSRNSRNSFHAEMDLDCLPQMTKRPMNIRDVCSFDVGQARMEFFLVNKLTEIEAKRLPRTTAERLENKFKNRFLNTHPYDFNRVILSQSEDGQEDGYINASFIPGFAGKEKEYIAAQGPKESTLGDFWQMILEQDARLIAMVTSLHECGKKKCEKYWPNKDELVVYGDHIQLELLKETTYSFYTKRNILLSKAPDIKREIQQFHFTAWPDFETPEQPEELIRFIEIVRRKARQMNSSSPIVVHCSAGVGRTGTFIALDYLIQQVLITDLVDVPKTVRHLRRYRLSMVQSEAQFVFLYSCIAHYVKTRLSQTE